MKILILGANGFIGQAIGRRLASDGHTLTGIGRNLDAARRRMPEVNWRSIDLAMMTSPEHWQPLLADNDIVVNCAGALQDGLRDDLAATQERAMLALYQAAKNIRLIVQISANTEGSAAETPFLATKASADRALAACGLPHVILRPALVVGRDAYGGTALVRALAGFPFVLPVVHANSPIATVDIDDVADAVAHAIDGTISPGSDIALASPETHTLGSLVTRHRSWLGLQPAPLIDFPPWLALPVSVLADLAGRLGWRSPLRSTAMTVMTEGVHTEAPRPEAAGLRTLDETLRRNPAGAQDLWFARLYLLKAPVIVGLSLFWLLSGLIPLLDVGTAAAHFEAFLSKPLALGATLATCLLDIALGLAILFRPFTRRALIGMLLVSLGYLAAATVAEPALWLDPLGPLVKVIPSLLLTLAALATLEER